MSEYTYDIDKYTIGVDENGEDGIGMTVAKIENGELHFLGNCYGENARCIDLLIKENQSLKKENKILRENAENNDKVVDKVNWENMLLKKENEQLKDNWNKLREYIKETKLKEFEKGYGKRYGKTFTQAEIVVCNMIMDKMQELEGSDSNEKRM